jgi:hypothetical protein
MGLWGILVRGRTERDRERTEIELERESKFQMRQVIRKPEVDVISTR